VPHGGSKHDTIVTVEIKEIAIDRLTSGAKMEDKP